ncbi:CLUMA_CG011527, isoform A [Clunio marinus]|uniref:CLUMA_CG011527, isoform A n=1 Tax=Clunio marinus TaxID=568069 RepID=A0A1J1II81_9DIPT|nr:CLUMA_CG011527, isoform A [Clunio marinus]
MAELYDEKNSLNSNSYSNNLNESFSNTSELLMNLTPNTAKLNKLRWFSPMVNANMKSPGLSPIRKTEDSPSETFLKSREMKGRICSKRPKKHRSSRTCFNLSVSSEENSNDLNEKISLKLILKNLGFLNLYPIFRREEIDFPVMFTLNDKDLNDIGIDDANALYSQVTGTKAEQKKLKHMIKKEFKSAKRELRRDNEFVSKIRHKRRQEQDHERQGKVKRIFNEASIQQSEYNALSRTKERKGRF